MQRQHESNAVELAYITPRLTNAFIADESYLTEYARTMLGGHIDSEDVLKRTVEQMQLRAHTLSEAIFVRHVPTLLAFRRDALESELSEAKDQRQRRLILRKYLSLVSAARQFPQQLTVILLDPGMPLHGASFALIRTPDLTVAATANQAQATPLGANSQVISSQSGEISAYQSKVAALRRTSTPGGPGPIDVIDGQISRLANRWNIPAPY